MTAKATMERLKRRREQAVANTMTWQQKAQFNLNVIAEHLGITLTVGAFNPATNEYASLVCAGGSGVTKTSAAEYLRKVGKQMIADADRVEGKEPPAQPFADTDPEVSFKAAGVSDDYLPTMPEPVTSEWATKEENLAALARAKLHGPYCYAKDPAKLDVYCAELHGHEGPHHFERALP